MAAAIANVNWAEVLRPVAELTWKQQYCEHEYPMNHDIDGCIWQSHHCSHCGKLRQEDDDEEEEA